MSGKLSKVAREFNVGISTIVDFLHSKGGGISSNPNAKLTDDEYALVAKEFSSDSEVKKESSLVDLKNTRKKKETVSIDASGNVTSKKLEASSDDTFISVKDEVKLENNIKIVNRIDLNPAPKVEKQAEIIEVKAETSEIQTPQKEDAVIETKLNQEPELEKKTVEKETVEQIIEVEAKKEVIEVISTTEPTEVAEVTEVAKVATTTEVDEDAPFKLAQPTLKEVKVIGTIDLSAINQRTRPPKKSKLEKERDRRDQKKSSKPATPGSPQSDQEVKPQQAATSDDSDVKKKRKRIIRQDERVSVDTVLANNTSTSPSVAKNPKSSDPSNKLKKLKKKKNEKTEITSDDINKQIKDTFARLGGKGKSQSSKHRRDKRDAVQQKIQADLEQDEKTKSVLQMTEFVTVAELATMMDSTVTEVISACMSLGLFVSINQRLDAETINIVADEFGFTVEFVSVEIQEAIDDEEVDTEESLKPRPPIVTVMGHVDHGKTSLLDSIRKTDVIAGEAGGITQHIGAHNVKLADGRTITFLDTPGHEAFTAMRARGAQVTDIAIIIIAADDSVMPQTVEAINHASAAGVPIVFAINKIDKPGVNPEKIREELANMNFLVEEWGGKYQCQEIAAKKGINIEELLEKVLLEAEMLELKANPNKKAVGSIIESSLDKGRGYVSTVLVQAGTLKVGDIILAGQYFGHVKAMFNEKGEKIETAGPSEAAAILGLNGAPQAGDKFNVMLSEKEARLLANKREQLQREQGLRTQKHITLDEIGRRIAIGNFQELNVIVKGDVDGSIEALSDSLIKLSTDEIQVNIIHKAVGQITEGDVLLAAASNAIIIGFQVRPSLSARKLAEQEQIDIRLYSVIYQAIDELRSAMEGMLSPEIKEEIIATIEVLEAFKITKVGTVAGCIVRDGKITRSTRIRVIRDGIVIYSGGLGSLKRFKDDVKEVAKGFECGLNVENFNDIQVGDFIEGYIEIEVKKTL